MASKPVRVNPLDFQPSVAIGVSLPFNGKAVFRSTYTTQDQIKSNILNYFLTNRGERLFLPDFGAGLREQIFEQLESNNIDGIRNLIERDFELYFPRVVIEDLRFEATPDLNLLRIELEYSIIETNISDEISLSFERNG